VPITIGGDGSVTVPVARAVGKKHGKMAALHIDSHTDSYPYDPAEKYNSATQFTHVAEEGLGRPGALLARRHPQHHLRAGRRAARHEPRLPGRVDRRAAGRGALPFASPSSAQVGETPVYLCFDMDVFDPSCAPGVCTPSWGGFSAREGIDLMRCLTDLNIVAVDVNTVSPPQDVNGMAAHLCAHVIYETLVLLCRQMGLADA
jgi:arginase family enzyme